MFSIPLIFLAIALIVSSISDLRFRRIPNWLTYPVMITGIVYFTSLRGLDGLFFSLGGIGVGFVLMIGFYLLGGTGAGDVKLMAAVGGFLGPKGVFMAFLITSIVGGIYAVILLAVKGYLKQTIKRYWNILKTLILTRQFIYIPSSAKEKQLKLCYGLAISLGTIISLTLGNS